MLLSELLDAICIWLVISAQQSTTALVCQYCSFALSAGQVPSEPCRQNCRSSAQKISRHTSNAYQPIPWILKCCARNQQRRKKRSPIGDGDHRRCRDGRIVV